jgi:hypothetical protein
VDEFVLRLRPARAELPLEVEPLVLAEKSPHCFLPD